MNQGLRIIGFRHMLSKVIMTNKIVNFRNRIHNFNLIMKFLILHTIYLHINKFFHVIGVAVVAAEFAAIFFTTRCCKRFRFGGSGGPTSDKSLTGCLVVFRLYGCCTGIF